jgi:hypothetical protein
MTAQDEQAQVLGHVIAAGVSGGPILDRLVAAGGDTVSIAGMSPAELQALRNSLTRTPQERLALIVDMLRAEMASRPQVPGHPSRPAEAAAQERGVEQRETSLEDVKSEEETPSGSGPDGEELVSGGGRPQSDAYADPKSALVDKSLDPSVRVDAAVEMGEAAIPVLTAMMRGGRDEKEVATVSLMRMVREKPGTALRVHDEMKLLEGEPEVRRTAEYVRRGVEDVGGTRPGSQQHLSDQANIGDGWLSRAIASCDRPDILCAASGREFRAIPLALRQLVSMRSKRTSDLQ